MNQAHDKFRASITQWHEFVTTQDDKIFDALVADEAVFRSPFLWKPKHGKNTLRIVLNAASQVFEDFAYHRELTDGSSVVLEFSAHIGAIELKGIDLIRFNEDGKIIEFEVMVRPFKGLQALAEAMGNQFKAQGNYETFLAS